MHQRPHVLIIVQNLPVPLDRRVWLECRALVAAGYDVSVICPRGPGDPATAVIDGVRILKYRPAREALGVLSYVWEFVYSWGRTLGLARRLWRTHPFQVIQACNPPDTYWLLARLWRRHGVRFVFDQHDLNPELFLSRFGTPRSISARLQLAGLRWLERMTYRTADHVISTNRSYKRVAIERGGLCSDQVSIVRSGPDTAVMRPVKPIGGRRKRHSLVYLGIMGPQDGVETILEVMHELVHVRGRTDVEAVLLGFGDCLLDLQRQSHELGLDGVVTFVGRADGPMIAEHLSAATVGLCPDLKTPLNDVSTMNKTMEYMAYALPSISFDLVETRVTGRDACLYVPSGDVAGFADAVELLLEDPDLRFRMAKLARSRAAHVLDWRPQAEAYVHVFGRLVTPPQPRSAAPATDAPGAPVPDRFVDVDEEDELRRFVMGRGPARDTHVLGV